MKHKRINEDEPYEDGDNFDEHIGFQNITNPFQLLEKDFDRFSIGSDDESEGDKEDEEESKFGNVLKHGIKRNIKQRDGDKFNSFLTFKRPQAKLVVLKTIQK